MRAGGVPRVNPVLRRELVERWRGRRAITTLTVYLAVLSALLYALYAVAQAVLRDRLGFDSGLDAATTAPVLGRFLFDWFATFVLVLVLFVGPGYAAAQLSGERERRTLPLLQITLLSPLQIALGKLWASVAWLGLLVVAAVPLSAATLFLGGVGIGDLLRVLALVVVVAVGVAGLALGISALVRRTSTAVVLTYATVLGLVLGTLAVAAVEFSLRSREDLEGTTLALYANPFFGLADAAGSRSSSGGLDLPSVLGFVAQALPENDTEEQAAFAVGVVGPGPPVPLPAPAPIGGPPPEPRDDPTWLVVGAVYLVLGALGVGVAARRLRIGGRSRRLRGGFTPPGTDPSRAAPSPVGTPG